MYAKYDDATAKVTTRHVVFMKQCHESSDDYLLFPVTTCTEIRVAGSARASKDLTVRARSNRN